jgi:hypothetical protein
MFDCEVRLDITLSEKRSSSANVDFKVVVGVKIAGGETDGGNWRQLDKPDPRIPAAGRWIPVPTGVILKSGGAQFAFLKTMGLPPQVGATGEILVFAPGQREYLSSNLAWRGHGDFQVLERKINLPLPKSPGTWAIMKRNIWDTVGTGLEWELTSTGGFSLAGGAGGRGVEFLRGNLYVKHMKKPYEERSFTYTAGGGGFMIPGFGGSYSDQDWPSIGTEVTKGNLPISDPFRLEDLEGACQIVDLNLGGIMPTPSPYGHLPGGLGAGANLLGVIFGVPAGLALGAFKGTGWVAGPAALAGKSGISGGATLNVGYMSLNKR